MRRGHRRREERGAAAVEAALIFPILFALVFGMIEMAFLMKDNVAVASATRVGARIASAAPNAGPAVCDGEVSCPEGVGVPQFAQMAADAMETNGGAVPTKQIREIWIYNAGANGFPINQSDFSGPCKTQCVLYKWSELRKGFRYGGGNWNEVATNVCATEGARVGVYMKTEHPWLIRYPFLPGLASSVVVEDHAVMAFEPLTFEDDCG